MHFQILTSITDTDPKKWNKFVTENSGSVFHSYEWLLTYEQDAPHDSKACHIIMSDDAGNWLGLIPCFATQNCPRFSRWRISVVKNPTTIKEPILLSHSVYGFYGYPLVIREDKKLYLELLHCYKQAASELNIPVYGFASIPESRKILLECLKEAGFTISFRNTSSLIDVRWNTFEEYLKSLPKKMRTFIHWMENKYKRQQVEISVDFSTPQIDNLNLMINAVLERHKREKATEYFPRKYLENLISEFKENIFVVTASCNNRIIFMNLCLRFGETLVPWIGGINYEEIGDLSYHYFYGWIVKYAIENGYSVVDCGRSSYETKRRYGYYKENLFFCMNTIDPSLSNELIRWTSELEDYSQKNLSK